jgi:hypothetical protein
MKVCIEDSKVLASVSAVDLVGYLRATGWSKLGEDPAASVWEKVFTHGLLAIEAPKNANWRDYPACVRAVLDVLAQAEARSQLAIVRDIADVATDVVRIRAMTPTIQDGSISLRDGLSLTSLAERMMLAAACAAEEPKRAYHSRKPKRAIDFAASLRLGQTERGSYVLAVLSSVPPELASSQLQLESEAPYERSVIETLAQSLTAVRNAAQLGAASGNLDAFEQAVPLGVSADLCEALTSMSKDGAVSAIEVQIAWAPSRPGPASLARSTLFERDVLRVIAEAGTSLRLKTPVDDFTLEGPVVQVSRPTEARAGEAMVLASVDGRSRRVAVALADDDWDTANKAFTERLLLRCEGELWRATKPLTLKNPRHLQLIKDQDL